MQLTMQLPIYQADAFTSELFKGNPAAYVPLARWLDDQLLLEFASAEVVAGLSPDMRELLKLPYKGLICTAPGEGFGCDFVSRFFAPRHWYRRRPGDRLRTHPAGAVLGAKAGKDESVRQTDLAPRR
ncbi:hypothetical protein [Microbulbifer pacificus]|uniref:Uncharacterized protein n=1 Tax=Microbulbifer pacificus TaxID=407164 RepID=A0AAU0N5M7_9GAMM|nr:hypothetical protein [Microbulbifer pacificus]WOX07337.1 hypothetical protein R5R33_12055 [Microbulbifer pacificus]